MASLGLAAPFLAAIRSAPADDAPRLVYADWLDENGDSARAEFIRVQVELARYGSADLRAREAELLARNHDDFAGPMAFAEVRYRFERGFIVAFGHTGVFLSPRGTWADMLRIFPNRRVIFTASDRDPESLTRNFGLQNKFLSNGSYTIDALEYPADISFECSSPHERYHNIRVRGSFDGHTLWTDPTSRRGDYPYVCQFSIYHIDGFDSFSAPPA